MMASLINVLPPNAPKALSPSFPGKGTSTVSLGGGYCFLTDNPESVGTADLVDSATGKKWLNKQPVSGAGLVYYWHTNKTTASFYTCLLVWNDDPVETIRVTSTNYGTSSSSGGSDTEGWKKYFAGGTPLVKDIPAKSFGQLFIQSIPAGYNYGLVARTNVTYATGTNAGNPAPALFYDLAYLSNHIGATDYAAKQDPVMRRGKAPTYYNTFNLSRITPIDEHGVAFKICGSSAYPGDFGTDDIPYVTDLATGVNNTSGYLGGAYGQQYVVNMKIYNSFNVAKTFNIFIGGHPTGNYFPFVNMGGATMTHDWGGAGTFWDVITTGPVSALTEVTVSFNFVVPAMCSTAMRIGARIPL